MMPFYHLQSPVPHTRDEKAGDEAGARGRPAISSPTPGVRGESQMKERE